MPVERPQGGAVAPATQAPYSTPGDVPGAVRRRYAIAEGRADDLAFYRDRDAPFPSFRDQGRLLVTRRIDPEAIQDMAAIAKHRGWLMVSVRGSKDFRREAWLAGRAMGLEVRGYRPSERDIQALQDRMQGALKTKHRHDRTRDGGKVQQRQSTDEARKRRGADPGALASLRIIEAVVRARISDPERQATIMEGAHARIAAWRVRGARFDLDLGRITTTRPGPDRQRSR